MKKRQGHPLEGRRLRALAANEIHGAGSRRGSASSIAGATCQGREERAARASLYRHATGGIQVQQMHPAARA